MIRNHLPDVTVCELPEDPTYFAETPHQRDSLNQIFYPRKIKKEL